MNIDASHRKRRYEGALEKLWNASGRTWSAALNDDAIRHLLSFDGRIVSEEELTELEAAANEYGDTAVGSAMRLTLVSRRLS